MPRDVTDLDAFRQATAHPHSGPATGPPTRNDVLGLLADIDGVRDAMHRKVVRDWCESICGPGCVINANDPTWEGCDG